MQLVERSFHKNGNMKAIADPADKRRLKGHLPFWSCDSWDEAFTVIEEAIRQGELYRTPDGRLIETRLAEEQTLDILMDAGWVLEHIHRELYPDKYPEAQGA